MPQGVKPEVAINKVLGDFLQKEDFKLKRSQSPEYYIYTRVKKGITQTLDITINWTHKLLIQEGIQLKALFPKEYEEDWGSYQHYLDISLDGYKKGGNLSGIIFCKKYPHLTSKIAQR